MVAVVVSSANRCYYCLVAHGAAVRQLSGDPELGEMLALNYRVATLDPRQRTMMDFVWKLTLTPHLIEDADRDALSQQGLKLGGHLRSCRNHGLVQSLESHGLSHRYDAQSGVPSHCAVTGRPSDVTPGCHRCCAKGGGTPVSRQ